MYKLKNRLGNIRGMLEELVYTSPKVQEGGVLLDYPIDFHCTGRIISTFDFDT